MDPLDNTAGGSDAAAAAAAAKAARPIITDFTDAQFDFAAYIAGYSGFAKVIKCKFIAERAPKLAVRSKPTMFFCFFHTKKKKKKKKKLSRF
jgi:hypothetical protein